LRSATSRSLWLSWLKGLDDLDLTSSGLASFSYSIEKVVCAGCVGCAGCARLINRALSVEVRDRLDTVLMIVTFEKMRRQERSESFAKRKVVSRLIAGTAH
jgi:hypothetical protein